MNNTSGFYRIDSQGIFHHAPNFVYAPGYTLLREDAAHYDYPTEGGWVWFDSVAEACEHFRLDLKEQAGRLFPASS